MERADEVQRLLAAPGLKGRKSPDLVIAAHPELAGLTVVHYDVDFDHIASIAGQPSLWIAHALRLTEEATFQGCRQSESARLTLIPRTRERQPNLGSAEASGLGLIPRKR